MDNIRIAVRDSTDSYNVAFFDNESGIKFKTANLTKFLAGSASMLSLSFNSKDIDTVKTGCKLSFVYKNKPYWLNIMDIQKTGFKINLIAYSLVLEINNEQKGSYKSDKAQSIAQYVRIFDPENSLTIGINEVADKSIKLEWTGTDTLLDRLYSIANSFDAEFEFVTEVNSDYSLRRHVLNIYRKGNLGKDLTGQPVRVGKDLKVINYSDNIKELYSAVHATGKDGLTIAGLTKTVNDDAGKPLYVTDGAYLRAPQTRDRFPAVGRNSADNYLLLDLGSTEYETKEALYGYMLAELKKTSVPKISYTAEGSTDGEIADKMTLIDDLHFDPPLYVQARISEMTEDIITGRVTETTFTNYERKYSQLSDDLLKRVEELAKEAMPYTLDLATNNGTVFKNGAGNSQITPTLKRGSETISGASFVWTINGTSTTALTYTVSAAAVSGTSAVKVEAILAGKVVATTEVTFTDVSDGADGVGISSTTITYAASSSGTTAPSSGWTSNVPSVSQGQYLWTKTIWSYTDNTNETGYTVARMGADGSQGPKGDSTGIAISDTEPSTKYVNMLWKHTGNVSGLITGAMYRWTGSKWELYLFTAANISADTISAITADLGQISGGSLELLESVAQATSVDAWGSFTIPAHKWGLYIDNIGAISSGTPVRKSSSESTASDMPVAVLTSGQLRFARVNQNNDLGSVLHNGLSDPDNATISFAVTSDGTKQLLIQANGQIVNQGTNYTGWTSTGVAGVYYKRQGDIVALKMQVTTTANQHFGLGKIPVSLLPIQNVGTMMRVTAWTIDQSIGRNLQFNNSDGSIFLLPSSRGDAFNTQVTWII